MVTTLTSLLHQPDHPAWRDDRAYNADLARDLSHAYAAIIRGAPDTQGFTRARALVYKYRSSLVAKPQRLILCYALAMSFSAERAYLDAIPWLDEALDLAHELEDLGAYVEVARLRGAASSALCQIEEGGKYLTQCLQTLWMLGANHPEASLDPVLELGTLVDLAFVFTMLADFSEASWCLRAAQELAPHLPGCQAEAGMISWAHALVARYQGDLLDALGHALKASEVYSVAAQGALAAQCRLQTVVADVALDLAERALLRSQDTLSTAMMQLAAPFVYEAVRLAQQAADPAGEGLAQLTRVRYSRLVGQNVDRMRLVNRVIHVGRQLDDNALASQAYVALGREFASRGSSTDTQVACFRKGLETSMRSDGRVFEMLARRELLLAQEMRDA